MLTAIISSSRFGNTNSSFPRDLYFNNFKYNLLRTAWVATVFRLTESILKNLLQQNNNARKPQLLELGKVGTFPTIPSIDIGRIRPSPFDFLVLAWLPHQLLTAPKFIFPCDQEGVNLWLIALSTWVTVEAWSCSWPPLNASRLKTSVWGVMWIIHL